MLMANMLSSLRLTWNKSVLMILIVMLGGGVLAIWKPLWLAPPLLFYTDILYEILGLIWLPLAIAVLILGPPGNRNYRFIMIVTGLGFISMLCLIPGLAISLITVTNPGVAGQQGCQQEQIRQGILHYRCKFSGSSAAYTLEFEGPENSPFVQVVVNKPQ